MFEKFGEFDSAEELNRAASAQLAEGDTEAIYTIAEENGIDKEDAADFIAGDVPELSNPLMAAVGKLNIEAAVLRLSGLTEDWKGYIAQQCAENKELCLAVRKRGKKLELCMGEILRHAFEKKVRLADSIVKAAKLNPPLYLGIPGRADVKRIIENYYLK